MGTIRIQELEVHYRVGVPAEERATAQRLLISLSMETDFEDAAESDDLAHTVDYFAVCQRLLSFGDGRSWKLIEKLATDIAATILAESSVTSIEVEVRKFIIPEARYVAVSMKRMRQETQK